MPKNDINMAWRFIGFDYYENGERHPVYQSFPTGSLALKEFDLLAYKRKLKAKTADMRKFEKKGQLTLL